MVSLLASETLASSEDALQQAERILNRVTAMTRKIKEELGLKAIELQSFAPDELGNIPRKRKCICKRLKYYARNSDYIPP